MMQEITGLAALLTDKPSQLRLASNLEPSLTHRQFTILQCWWHGKTREETAARLSQRIFVQNLIRCSQGHLSRAIHPHHFRFPGPLAKKVPAFNPFRFDIDQAIAHMPGGFHDRGRPWWPRPGDPIRPAFGIDLFPSVTHLSRIRLFTSHSGSSR
jgi:hypothetical protein